MYEWMKLIGLDLERDNVAAKIQEVLLAPDTQFPLEHNICLMLRYYSCDAVRFLLLRFPYSCIKNTDTFSRRLNVIVNTVGPGWQEHILEQAEKSTDSVFDAIGCANEDHWECSLELFELYLDGIID